MTAADFGARAQAEEALDQAPSAVDSGAAGDPPGASRHARDATRVDEVLLDEARGGGKGREGEGRRGEIWRGQGFGCLLSS